MPSIRDTTADNFARQDQLSEDNKTDYQKRLYELLTTPSERDPETWESAGAPVGLNVESWNLVPFTHRTDEYNQMCQALFAAAMQQAREELVLRDMLVAADKGAKKLDTVTNQKSNQDIKQAAQEGIGKARFNAAKESRNGIQQ